MRGPRSRTPSPHHRPPASPATVAGLLPRLTTSATPELPLSVGPVLRLPCQYLRWPCSLVTGMCMVPVQLPFCMEGVAAVE